MALKLKLTRNQLASFLTDPEQIKQFEKLFEVGNVVIDVDVQGTQLDVGNALAQVASLAGTVSALAQTGALEASTALSVAQNVAASLSSLADIANAAALQPAPAAPCCPPEFTPPNVLSPPADELTSPLIPSRRNVVAAHDMTRQVLATPNVEAPMIFSAVDISRGAWGDTGGGGAGKMYVADAGVYDIQFSAQVDSNKGADSELWIWLRVNGVDVAESASVIRVKGNDGETVAAWNWLVELPANVSFQIMWTADSVQTYLETFAAAGVVPAIPSVIITVAQEA